MSLIDVMTSPWAIEPRAFETICAIVNRRLAGETADVAEISARLGRPLSNEKRQMTVTGGVAVIELSGPLARSMNLMHDISGGTSTQVVASQLDQALADSSVHSIVLAIDSPGGTVAGSQELADRVFEGRSKKTIVAAAESMMASAAYWIGSSASKVFLSSDTDQVGSIGVVATHVDQSARDAQFGVKFSEITAGKYKRVASEHAPLSAEGRAYVQAQVDHMYSIFVGAVARNRGASSDRVLADMADGRIFTGRQAVTAGLVDGIKPLAQVIKELSAAGGRVASITAAVMPAVSLEGASPPAVSLTLEELKELGLRVTKAEAEYLTSGVAPKTPHAVSLHARVYEARMRAQGRRVSSAEAVDHVMKEFHLG